MNRDVTVCIPTIPPRVEFLERALHSVTEQVAPVSDIHVAYDLSHAGAGPTRNRAKADVRTTWTAFLDDDDWMGAEHLQVLFDHAEETAADVVYPWFTVMGGSDPFPEWFGKEWSNDDPHIIPVTCIVRTEIAARAMFASWNDWDHRQHWPGDDWPFWWKVMDLGAKIVHLPRRTWFWRHHPGNLSGLPTW